MTLLITIVGTDFALSCSDMRISTQQGNKFVSVDEKFNKHTIFHSKGFTGNISYTGIAQWSIKGKTVKLYDAISQSIAKSADASAAFGPLAYQLLIDIVDALKQPPLHLRAGQVSFELHIIGYHPQIPWPFIGVTRLNWPL